MLIFLLIAEPISLSLPVVFAVFIHEFGHILAQKLVCGKSEGIKHAPFGLSLPLSGGILSYKKEIFICAAGPLLNLLAALCSISIMHFAKMSNDSLLLFSASNILLALFNLLPIKTLDGGRIADALLSFFCLPDTAYKISLALSLLTSAILWVGTVYLWLTFQNSPYLIFLSLYLLTLSIYKK